MTTGKTFEETEINIREAIEQHLRTSRDFGDPVPQPTSVGRKVEIATGRLTSLGLRPFAAGNACYVGIRTAAASESQLNLKD